MADYDRREFLDDQGPLLRANNKALQAGLWTALPGIIVSFDPALMTCKVQPAIKAQVLDSAGKTNWVQLPLLVDCPVVFPSGGGFTLTFPLEDGDECLVVFASRCIDSWWQSGGVQVQAELRLHDLSDGFVIPGPHSKPEVVPGISTTDVQLRDRDGTTYVGIQPGGQLDIKAAGDVRVVADGEADITAPTIKLVGNVQITGNVTVTGTVTAADFKTATLPSYTSHIHVSNHGGPAPTTPPVPGT